MKPKLPQILITWSAEDKAYIACFHANSHYKYISAHGRSPIIACQRLIAASIIASRTK